MSSKILVVDDSPTVQKVVAITLANQDCELVQALNEDELFSKLKKGVFDLILLDFTISQKKTGYETIKQIQSLVKNPQILILLGQFDQVDEQLLAQVGITEKLIKPFDSARFIQRCRDLLDKKTPEVKMELEIQDEVPALEEKEWKLNSPKIELTREPHPTLAKSLPSQENLLKSEMESWNVAVPAIIGEKSSSSFEMPPVIEENFADNFFQTTLPAEDDLAYPDAGDVSTSLLTEATLSSKLISMSELAPESDDRGFIEEQTERLNLPDELSNNIENEIQDEAAKDFWMADIEMKTEEEPFAIASQTPDFELESKFPLSTNKDELMAKVKSSLPSISQEEILNQLREALPSIVEEYVKTYCEKMVERVAWEVIPDLAENLIRKELRTLAEGIEKD